jgi:hypothetical protein
LVKQRRWISLRATVWLANQTASAGATHALLLPCLNLRRDDFWRAAGLKIVIPAKAGIQRLSSKTNRFHHQGKLQKQPASHTF